MLGGSNESELGKRRGVAEGPGQTGRVRVQWARLEGPAPGGIGGEDPELGGGDEAEVSVERWGAQDAHQRLVCRLGGAQHGVQERVADPGALVVG